MGPSRKCDATVWRRTQNDAPDLRQSGVAKWIVTAATA